MTRSVQPEPPADAIVRQNGLSSAIAAGPQSLLHPCRGRSGVSRWSMVGHHRRVSTPVKAAHHPSSWCRFVGSGLLVHGVEVWRRDQRDLVFGLFACERCTRRRTGRCDAGLHPVHRHPWPIKTHCDNMDTNSQECVYIYGGGYTHYTVEVV